jgi:hypothetical protein
MPPEKGRVDRAAVPQNGNYLPQDLIVLEGPIFIGKGIAARDEAVAALPNHPVGYEPMVAIAQRNLAWKEFRHTPPANCQDIPGPHGRDHAGSGGFEAHLAKGARDIGDQVALDGSARVRL